MLTRYLQAAMRLAHYEILADDGSYYGEIPECPGALANAPTLEECREQLAEVLEDWILVRMHRGLSMPVLDEIDLSVHEAA